MVKNFSEAIFWNLKETLVEFIEFFFSLVILSQRWGSHLAESCSMVKEVLQVSKVQDPDFRRGVWMCRAI